MDATPWLERWRSGRIGFHREEVHPRLVAHWGSLLLPPTETVFVPLCGKSLDMRWLAGRGHRVRGVELSEIAATDFFAEWGRRPHVEERGRFVVHAAAGVEIWVGDVFDLVADDLADAGAFYDRAALVAFDAPGRVQYTQQLARILRPGARGLLVALDHVDEPGGGPPFVVRPDEVAATYDPWFEREALDQAPGASGTTPRATTSPGTGWSEHVYALRRREDRERPSD